MARKKSRRVASTTSMVSRRIDRCGNCEGVLRWRTATASRPHVLRDYGFPLRVVGLPVAACGKCGNEYAAVGSAERFRRSILEQILLKPAPLSSDEIVFLRKTLGMTGGNFADLVGVSREHVSHIEQGHAPNLGTAADRLARLMIAAKVDPTLKLMKRLLGSLDEHIGTRARRKPVRHDGYCLNVTSKRA